MSIKPFASMSWIVFPLLFMGGMAQSKEMRCNYTVRFSCSPMGCTPMQENAVTRNFLIVPQLSDFRDYSNGDEIPEVRRCDDKGCTTSQVFPSEASANMNLTAVGYSLNIYTVDLDMLRTKRGQFLEIATLANHVLVSYGSCPLPEEGRNKDEKY